MTATVLRVVVGVGALVWAAVGIAAGVALARAINVVQCPDRAPLDRRDWLLVDDILRAAAEVTE